MPFFDESLFDGGDLPLIPFPPIPPDGYLGRYQLGQSVVLAVEPVDGGGFPTIPDAAPVATITDPDSHVVAVVKLAIDGDSYHFALRYFLGFGLGLGSYGVSYSFVVAGAESTSSGSFDLISGGDPGGRIVSLYAYDRPEARYVVAQLASGRLVQGRNPRLP